MAGDLAPNLREKIFFVSYQWWLAAAALVNGGVGALMTTTAARAFNAPSTQAGGIDNGRAIPATRNW